ncbi:MAG: NADH-quinone oxidoreductase subunit D [Candidatus Krumholzibacteriia bacterium]|nr:NADH-quinone oxidoreductase subunit D [bacterium]MCB9516006.1 NADH-quinone oxidoreductase subunit D [Candidatus Latescibacterota bacterium]
MAEVKTELMTLNMGPQHPSTHGVIRFQLETDGEVIHQCVPDVGYLHRSIEKIAEGLEYFQFMPFTDRVDYVAAINANHGWAVTCERMAGLEVPERGELLRVIAAELVRLSSHLVGVGSNAGDLGAVTPFLHALREREKVNDLIEELCGARLTHNYVRIGGVSQDAPAGWTDKVLRFCDAHLPALDEFDRLITFNKIFRERLANVAIISAEDAMGFGLAGPSLRGSGVDFDCRRDDPYGLYPSLNFEVPVGQGLMGTVGDCWDRFWCRVQEMRQSVALIRQAIERLPASGAEFWNEKKVLKPPAGEYYVRTESARGELGYYVVSDGSKQPYRVKIRTGSFAAMSIVEKIAKGLMIADLIAIIGSLDVVAPEIDR